MFDIGEIEYRSHFRAKSPQHHQLKNDGNEPKVFIAHQPWR